MPQELLSQVSADYLLFIALNRRTFPVNSKQTAQKPPASSLRAVSACCGIAHCQASVLSHESGGSGGLSSQLAPSITDPACSAACRLSYSPLMPLPHNHMLAIYIMQSAALP